MHNEYCYLRRFFRLPPNPAQQQLLRAARIVTMLPDIGYITSTRRFASTFTVHSTNIISTTVAHSNDSQPLSTGRRSYESALTANALRPSETKTEDEFLNNYLHIIYKIIIPSQNEDSYSKNKIFGFVCVSNIQIF